MRFEVQHPLNIDQACSLLSEFGYRAKIIAGGHGLLPLLKSGAISPPYLINIKGLKGLDYIKQSKEGISIGALTTNRSVEISPLLNEKLPVLAEVERYLGDIQTRNWGTLVGNLCMSSPTSDLAPLLISLGATISVISSRGKRTIRLEDFFVGYMKAALAPDEMAVEVNIPNLPPRTGVFYHKERERLTDSPIASAAALVTLDTGLDSAMRAIVVLQAVGPTPIRVRTAEELIVGAKITGGAISDTTLTEILEAAGQAAEPISDVYGSAEYKREMVKTAVSIAVKEAIERACAV